MAHTSTKPDTLPSVSGSKKPLGKRDTDTQKHYAIQNVVFVWVDATIDENDPDTQHTLQQLRVILNDVVLFQDPDECIAFLNEIQSDSVTVMSSGSLGKDLIPRIHSLIQVNSVYIFCYDPSLYESWAKKWSKIKGVYDHIEPICNALQQSVQQANQNSTPISIIRLYADNISSSLNELDPSFICTKILKNILGSMRSDNRSRQDLIIYARSIYTGNSSELKMIEEFDQDYQPERSIWWYTRNCFLLRMLNHAFGLLDAHMIYDIAFFVQDLHRQIEHLYEEQFNQYHGEMIRLYRGQGLPSTVFEQMKKARGGFLSFNSFLSVSSERESALLLTQLTSVRENMMGILFVITIDPKITNVPFANISSVNYQHDSAEILFSIQAIFRIGEIKSIDKSQGLFEVQLTLASNEDKDLCLLNVGIENGFELKNDSGWPCLASLFMRVKKMDDAEELYLKLLERVSSQREEAHYYHQLATIKELQNAYEAALDYYQRILVIYEVILDKIDPELANIYFSIATMYNKLNQFLKAVFYYGHSLNIREKIISQDDPLLTTTYSSIAIAYENLGDHNQALLYFTKAFEINKKKLNIDNNTLMNDYMNVGRMYIETAEYQKALLHFSTLLELLQKKLPKDHPHLILTYNHMGVIYEHTGDYTKAMSYYNKALELSLKNNVSNQLHLAMSYNNLGIVHLKRGEHQQALTLHYKALHIYEKTLPENHPHLGTTYNNIASAYNCIGEYKRALDCYKKAFDLLVKILPESHPSVSIYYNNMGLLYDKMGDYSKAKESCDKALSIRERILSLNHPDLAISYNTIGILYTKIGQFSKALSHYEKAFEIRQQILSTDHSDLAASYSNIALTYTSMHEYARTLTYYEKALQIYQRTLPNNHPRLITCYSNIGSAYLHLKDYSRALHYYTKALEMKEKHHPDNENDISFANSYNNLGSLHYQMEQYPKALVYFQKALTILQRLPIPNPVAIQNVTIWIDFVKKKL